MRSVCARPSWALAIAKLIGGAPLPMLPSAVVCLPALKDEDEKCGLKATRPSSCLHFYLLIWLRLHRRDFTRERVQIQWRVLLCVQCASLSLAEAIYCSRGPNTHRTPGNRLTFPFHFFHFPSVRRLILLRPEIHIKSVIIFDWISFSFCFSLYEELRKSLLNWNLSDFLCCPNV